MAFNHLQSRSTAGFTQSVKCALGGPTPSFVHTRDFDLPLDNSFHISPHRALRGAKAHPTAGFTLIELLAVTAIIVVITSVVLVNNGRFGGVIQLENLAYDVALSIRQAQVYGISVQRLGIDCSAQDSKCFESGYGVHFDMDNRQQYVLFADVDKDGFFTSNLNLNENVEPSPYTIRSGFEISGLCAPEGTCGVGKIDIVFRRPEPDAFISKNGDGTPLDSARIILKSPRGDTMSVVVEINGQISVRRGEQ